jgi:hypothetical protein
MWRPFAAMVAMTALVLAMAWAIDRCFPDAMNVPVN